MFLKQNNANGNTDVYGNSTICFREMFLIQLALLHVIFWQCYVKQLMYLIMRLVCVALTVLLFL